MVFTYRARYGVHVTRVYSRYFHGWVDCRDAFHAVLCLAILLYNGQNIAEKEAY